MAAKKKGDNSPSVKEVQIQWYLDHHKKGSDVDLDTLDQHGKLNAVKEHYTKQTSKTAYTDA